MREYTLRIKVTVWTLNNFDLHPHPLLEVIRVSYVLIIIVGLRLMHLVWTSGYRECLVNCFFHFSIT